MLELESGARGVYILVCVLTDMSEESMIPLLSYTVVFRCGFVIFANGLDLG